MNIEPKNFAKVSVDQGTQLALLPKDVMLFHMMAFSGISDMYVYTGSKKLDVVEDDLQNILNQRDTEYNCLRIDERRKHFERIHEKYSGSEDYPEYPVVTVYNEEKQSTELIPTLSQYAHTRYTPDINYTFNPDFIKHNNAFTSGYRNVCVDVLDMLVSKYSRLFFIYLSGDKQEFRFREENLRKLLSVGGKYKRRAALLPILECVQNELKQYDIDFDYSWCTEAEWEEYKKIKDDPNHKAPDEEEQKKNKKNKTFKKSFWFRAKGMDKYRIPKISQSIFEKELAANGEYRMVHTYFRKKLHMSEEYILLNWEYVMRYIDHFGAKDLINFAQFKMQQMAKQEKKPYNPKSVLISLIVNKVKDLDTQGRGKQTIFNKPTVEQDNRYDPKGKTAEEIKRDADEYLSRAP